MLRQVAAAIEMDTALLSKFERDERTPSRNQVIIFAKYYGINKDDLILAWLSDKIAGELQHEHLAKEVLKIDAKKSDPVQKAMTSIKTIL